MPNSSHTEIARRLWTAVAEGDSPAIRDLLAEEVSWRSFGRNPLSGEYRGPDAVLEYLARIGDAAERLVSTLERIYESDDGAVITYHARATRGSRVLDLDYVLVLRIHDGRVVRAAAIPTDQYENDKFWT